MWLKRPFLIFFKMSKTLKKFKKQYETDDRHHDAKRKKLVYSNKQMKNIDKILKTKDVQRILNYDTE